MDNEALKKLRAKMNRTPNEGEMKKLERALEVEVQNGNIAVEDGHQFVRDLKKEAYRQRAVKSAENLELQAKEISRIPICGSSVEEAVLADSFEIIEEDYA